MRGSLGLRYPLSEFAPKNKEIPVPNNPGVYRQRRSGQIQEYGESSPHFRLSLSLISFPEHQALSFSSTPGGSMRMNAPIGNAPLFLLLGVTGCSQVSQGPVGQQKDRVVSVAAAAAWKFA